MFVRKIIAISKNLVKISIVFFLRKNNVAVKRETKTKFSAYDILCHHVSE